MEAEKWDLYDKDYRKVSVFTRGGGMIPRGYYHKVVEIIPTDMAGTMLLTRRAENKRMGGKLEFPAGSVISGETEEQAAVRELREETGLRPVKIFLLQRYRVEGLIRYTYLAYIPDLVNEAINYDPNEVMGYKFVTYEAWINLLTTSAYNPARLNCYNEKLFTVVRELVQRYIKDAETPQIEKSGSHKPLATAGGLKAKAPSHLDKRCYEEDAPPPREQEWEPAVEQGDDGS